MRKPTITRWTLSGALLVAVTGLVMFAPRASAQDDATPWLGVYTQTLTDELREAIGVREAGALVSRVVDGSPAEVAKLKQGDVILRYNNRIVDGPADLSDLVRNSRVGQRVSIQVMRDRTRRTLGVTLAARDGAESEGRERVFMRDDREDADRGGEGERRVLRFKGGDGERKVLRFRSGDGAKDSDEGDVHVWRSRDGDERRVEIKVEGDGDGKPRVFKMKKDDEGVWTWNDKDGEWKKAEGDMHFEGLKDLEGLRGLEELKDLEIDIPHLSVMGRPRLGVQIQDLNEGLSEYFGTSSGALVTDVVEGSAAAKAGIKAGDVITNVGGKSVGSASDLRERVSDAGEGDVAITVVRKGRTQALNARLEKSEAFSWRGDGPVRIRDVMRGRAGDMRERAREMRDRTRAMRERSRDSRDDVRSLREQLRELERRLQELEEDR